MIIRKQWVRTNGNSTLAKHEKQFASRDTFAKLLKVWTNNKISKDLLKKQTGFTTRGTNGEVVFKPIVMDGKPLEVGNKMVFLSTEVLQVLEKLNRANGDNIMFDAIKAAHDHPEHQLIKALTVTSRDKDEIIVCGRRICELRPRLFFDREHWTGELRMIGFEGDEGLFFIEVGMHHQIQMMIFKTIACVGENFTDEIENTNSNWRKTSCANFTFLNEHLKTLLLKQKLECFLMHSDHVRDKSICNETKKRIGASLSLAREKIRELGHDCRSSEMAQELIEKTTLSPDNSWTKSVVEQLQKAKANNAALVH